MGQLGDSASVRDLNRITVVQRTRYLMDAEYHARVTIVKQAILLATDDKADPAKALTFAIAAVDSLEALDANS